MAANTTRWLGLALAFLACSAAPALADPPDAPVQTEAATPQALAAQLIASANAEGVFAYEPAEPKIGLRHARSGLLCRLDPGGANRLVIFPQAARGEDVACDSTDGRETVTFYATRYSFPTTLREQIDGAEAAIRRRFSNARAYPGGGDEADPALPASMSVRMFVTREDGARLYTRASVTMINGWSIKMRYTALAPDDAAARADEQAAGAAWRVMLTDIQAAGS